MRPLVVMASVENFAGYSMAIQADGQLRTWLRPTPHTLILRWSVDQMELWTPHSESMAK